MRSVALGDDGYVLVQLFPLAVAVAAFQDDAGVDGVFPFVQLRKANAPCNHEVWLAVAVARPVALAFGSSPPMPNDGIWSGAAC